jgi:hypothetical protein
MTTKDTLALALDALELCNEIGDQCSRGFLARAQAKAREAITAIKQAQEPVGINGLTEAETSASMSVMGLSKPQAPYPNCRFKICDLPGQCKGEGKCHHPAVQQAQEPVPTQITVTEDMHRAAVKVLHRAHGLDGLPQRMMDAMLAASPKQAEPAWKPIESAPKDGTCILLTDGATVTAGIYDANGGKHPWFVLDERDSEFTNGWQDTERYGPDFWMPLPTPPEAA